VDQLRSQADAAQAMLEELRAQPRKENLEVATAQVEMAKASLKTASDTLAKQEASYKLDPQSVSKDTLDNAINAEKVARANLEVVNRQYDLTRPAPGCSTFATRRSRPRLSTRRTRLRPPSWRSTPSRRRRTGS